MTGAEVEQTGPMASNKSEDFRDWDLEVETHTSGRDHKTGYPFYLWRESADNRLYLGRPRYCCIEPVGRELQFVFFDPTKDVKSTGALKAGLITTGIVAVLLTINGLLDLATRTPLPYSMDRRAPPFFILLGILFVSPLMGGLVAGPIYAYQTITRWMNGRFAGDGRLIPMPLSLLQGFREISARDAGAIVDGKPAQTGYGLAAVFEDGTQITLTGNAWNSESIIGKHRDLTQAFRIPRDKMLAEWAEALKKSDAFVAEVRKKRETADAPKGNDGNTDPAVPTKKGVPKKL